MLELAEMADVSASYHPLTNNVSEYIVANIILTDLPKTRQAAKECGSKYYYTGETCKNGHIDKRHAHNSLCLSCNAKSVIKNKDRIAERDRIYKAKNKARTSARMKIYLLSNKEEINSRQKLYLLNNKEKVNRLRKNRYEKNREVMLARQKKWRTENKELFYSGIQKWRKENPEAVVAQSHRKRAIKQKSEGDFSKKDIAAIHKLQGGKCACCRIKLKKYHVDHIVAISNGGSNWPSNLQLLCQSCNCSKGAKDPIDFMRSRGFLI